jgi:hypothetical protein
VGYVHAFSRYGKFFGHHQIQSKNERTESTSSLYQPTLLIDQRPDRLDFTHAAKRKQNDIR